MSRPVGTEKDIKYEARPGMFGDNTPPKENALISSLVENQLNNLQELDENQLKKSLNKKYSWWLDENQLKKSRFLLSKICRVR